MKRRPVMLTLESGPDAFDLAVEEIQKERSLSVTGDLSTGRWRWEVPVGWSSQAVQRWEPFSNEEIRRIKEERRLNAIRRSRSYALPYELPESMRPFVRKPAPAPTEEPQDSFDLAVEALQEYRRWGYANGYTDEQLEGFFSKIFGGVGGAFQQVTRTFAKVGKTTIETTGRAFKRVGSYVVPAAKKAIRYSGAAVAGTFMSAGARKRAFGLTDRESKGFETQAKVTRGVLAAAATAGTLAALGPQMASQVSNAVGFLSRGPVSGLVKSGAQMVLASKDANGNVSGQVYDMNQLPPEASMFPEGEAVRVDTSDMGDYPTPMQPQTAGEQDPEELQDALGSKLVPDAEPTTNINLGGITLIGAGLLMLLMLNAQKGRK